MGEAASHCAAAHVQRVRKLHLLTAMQPGTRCARAALAMQRPQAMNIIAKALPASPRRTKQGSADAQPVVILRHKRVLAPPQRAPVSSFA